MDSLANKQLETFNEITREYENFKKYGAARWNLPYMQNKIDSIQQLWAKFQARNAEITNLAAENQDHDYFTKCFASNAKKKYEEAIENIQLEMAGLQTGINKISPEDSSGDKKGESSKEGSHQPSTQNGPEINQMDNSKFDITFSEDTDQIRRYRRQTARITAIYRISTAVQQGEPSEFLLRHKLNQLEDYWRRFMAEDEEIESFRVPGDENETYHSMDKFLVTEQQYDRTMENIQNRLARFRTPRASTNDQMVDIQLPRVEIPKFNGSYTAWASFKELFTRIIGQRCSITGSQKIQYLKTYLIGNALNIIKHLDSTDENFDIAWKLLSDRYDNERIQFNKIIEVMVQQGGITGEPTNGLRRIHDTTNECIHALEKLGIDIKAADPIIHYLIYHKLDKESIMAYEQSLNNPTKLQPLETLLKFINHRFQALDGFKAKNEPNNNRRPNGNSSYRAHIAETNNEEKKFKCIKCDKDHRLYQCPDFAAMTATKRMEFANKNSLCKKCLTQHKGVCWYKQSCSICKGKHNTLLHMDTNPEKPGTTQKTGKNQKSTSTTIATKNEEKISSTQDVNAHFVKNNKTACNVLLATATIMVESSYGTMEPLRALIDQGSQASFITSKAVQQLHLKRKQINVCVSGIGAAGTGQVQGVATLNITPRFKSSFKTTCSAFVLKKITNMLPGFGVLKENEMLDTLVLADTEYYQTKSVDILLGADVFEEILLQGLIKGVNGTPMAQRTELGWILSGKTPISQQSDTIKSFVSNLELTQQLSKFWELEEVSEKRELTSEEKTCEEHFKVTHSRNSEGRYIVRLPLKDGHLEDSLGQATMRFNSLEKSLQRRPEMRTEYIKFMNEYKTMDHMAEVVKIQHSQKIPYFLPHHAVLRPSSSTTKLRVVFDASAKTRNGISLNNLMMVGPRLQRDLTEIIMRWRRHRIVFTADIAKMYRQILVHKDDQHLQQIIWRDELTQPLKHFQLKTITYGTASAPYLAIRTLQQLAIDEQEKYKIASKIVLNDFYVDDLMSGANSVNEALTAQKEIIQLLKSGGLPIRKWTSNNSQVLLGVPEGDREIKLPLQIDADDTIKALGIHWNPATDEFRYVVHLPEKQIVTKRQLVSEVAKLFDPVGWLSPIVITAKLLCQKLWLLGLDWDDKLPENITTEWNRYQSSLQHVSKIRISRWLNYNSDSDTIELHGFCDASITAFAAVIYVRIKKETSIHIQLLTSKTRVAPIKQISLPRLELCGASLLANLLTQIKMALEVSDENVYAWCDSTITLSWIRGHPTRWKTFVANRVVQIQERICPNKWNYINTKENPADVASRGCQPDELIKDNLWWNGPNWLTKNEFTWPAQPSAMDYLTTEEIKPTLSEHLFKNNDLCATGIIENVSIIERFSTLDRLIRVTVQCQRFLSKCKRIVSKNDFLSTVELETALWCWIRNIQKEHFPKEYFALENKKLIGTKSKLISLNPFIDEHSLIRVGGRLHNANMPLNRRHPIILPSKSHLTTLVIRDAHTKTCHGGVQLTMGKIRLKYWIIGGKNSTKWIINKCITCFKFRATNGTQLMGNLPEPRVNMSRPFTHVGVDFAGPISLKISPGRGTRTVKGYVCVFVCLSTKAMHLEPVTELTTQAFLATFRRFTGRRGVCSHIYSDCGTNFVGASKKLKTDYSEWSDYLTTELKDTLATSGTQWHFIPPGSPHFGGLWEAGVKSMKHHLKRIANYNLTFEELSTILCQIEGCLNSRPLCPLGNDPEDIEVLTPGHFLTGDSMFAIPEANLLDVQINRLTRWQLIQRIQQEFWNRWSSEYLARLQQRPKWKTQGPNVKQGSLVLIKDEQLPPNKWLLGRVTETHAGKDGIIRVVTLKNKTTTFKRPITKICLLPIDENELPAAEKLPEKFTESTANKQNEKPKINQRIMTRSKTKKPNVLISAVIYIMALFHIFFGTMAIPYFNGNLEVTPIDTQAGIYFEDIGRVNINSNTWQLIVYYDLENYWTEQKTYKNCLQLLETNCKRERNSHTYGEVQPGVLSDPDRMACITIHDKLKSMVEEISRRNKILYHGNQEQKKYKRSPLNIIGHIQHLLFGVLDEEFAQNYEQDIQKIKKNENHLQKLLANQTSIAEMTANIIRKNSDDIQKISNEFSQQLNNMTRNEQAHTSFIAAAFNLILHIITYQQTQDALIGLVLDTQHGRINPLLLSPEQFSRQISVIQGHIPSTVKLPAYKTGENLAKLYKLISTKARVLDSKIIIEMSIPLINREAFQLFNLIPVLTTQKNQSISLIPSAKYLAITLDRSKYWTMDEITFQKCINLDIDQYMCKSIAPIYTSTSGVAECEVQILSHLKKLAKSCRISIQPEPKLLSWNKLRAGNTWIVHAINSQSLDVICGEKLHSLTINGTILIEVKNNCEIKHASTIISAHEIYKSSLNSSFNPKINIHEYVNFNSNEKFLKSMKNSTNIELELQELENFIKTQKQEIGIPLDTMKISSHDIHQYVAIYTFMVFITIGCSIYLYIHYKTLLCKKCITKPIPSPRSQFDIEMMSE